MEVFAIVSYVVITIWITIVSCCAPDNCVQEKT